MIQTIVVKFMEQELDLSKMYTVEEGKECGLSTDFEAGMEANIVGGNHE